MSKNFCYLMVIGVFTALLCSGCGMKRESEESFDKAESIMASMEEQEKGDPEEKREGELKEKQVFNLVPYDIYFTFSDEWEKTEESAFDLQMTREEMYYCSIFGFKDIDLSNGMTPEDIFELQKNDLIEKRDFVELIRKEPVWEDEHKKVYRELYSGEFDEGKNYYYCCLIDFKEPGEGFAWVLFSGVPSWIENDIEELDQILMTAEESF